MTRIDDSKLTQYNHSKQNLIRRFDRKEINENDYMQLIKNINEKISQRCQLFFDQFSKKKIEKIDKKLEEKKMEEEKGKKKVVGASIKKNSKIAFITQGLLNKKLKTPEEVAEWIKEQKPDEDLNKLVNYVKVIVKEIKTVKKPRWTGYTFNDEKYLLIQPVE